MPDDGCDHCEVEAPYWECDSASPSVCDGVCGDLILVGFETCEDNNLVSLDGCSSDCRKELGWLETFPAPNPPSANDIFTFVSVCGDGYRVTGETCDAGALTGC